MRGFRRLVPPVAIVLLLAGCSSGALSRNMVPKEAAVASRNPGSVLVKAGGGSETSPIWTSQISSEAFRDAVVESLKTHGVFRTVLTEGTTDYRLEAVIMSLDQPMFGMDMTVTIEVAWRLTDLRDGRTVMNESIRTSGTATFSDAFSGATRTRMANEGAARENIREAIRRISGKSP